MSISDLLRRTRIHSSFDVFLGEVKKKYDAIGRIVSYKPVREGYEDANFFLKCSRGEYVLKVFSKERSERNIYDYAKVIREARKVGVETLESVEGAEGDINRVGETYFMITKYFKGRNFQDRTPSRSQILAVTDNISKLNTLDFPIEESYDSWGNKNLIHEYAESRLKEARVLRDILPLIDSLKSIDFKGFSRSVIHGDMQRKHVLEKDGKYCIIDYGCISNDLKVYELSTHISWFCLGNDNWRRRDEIYELVVEAYTRRHKLTSSEKRCVKLLVCAAYASYYLKTAWLLEKGEKSDETLGWYRDSESLFYKCMKWVGL